LLYIYEASRLQRVRRIRSTEAVMERRPVLWLNIRPPVENRDVTSRLQNALGLSQKVSAISNLMPH
jgi:hypothetical protein